MSDTFVEELLSDDILEPQRTIIKNKCYEISLAIKACRTQGKQSTFRSDTKTIVIHAASMQNIIIRISDNSRHGMFITLSELLNILPSRMQNLISSYLNRNLIILDGIYIKIVRSVSNLAIGLMLSFIFNDNKISNIIPPKKTPEIKMEYIIENPEDRTKYHDFITNEIIDYKDRKALVVELANIYGLEFNPLKSSKFLDKYICLEESINMPREIKPPKFNRFFWM